MSINICGLNICVGRRFCDGNVVLLGVILVAVTVSGCTKMHRPAPRLYQPARSFTGPDFLRHSVGALTQLTKPSSEYLLVSGYGLVVGLDGTGSSQVDLSIRPEILNQARKLSPLSARQGKPHLTPRQLLESRDTAVVAVEGLIPPGAPKGTRFDLLVSALPQTDVVSLARGKLWSTPLSIYGTTPKLYTRQLANASGSIYINPFEVTHEQEDQPVHRQAVIIGGGVVTQDQAIELQLRQPSFDRARVIADRINERFGHERSTEIFNTAVAVSDQLIEINIPRRFLPDLDLFLGLVSHLYLDRGPNVEIEKATELAMNLRDNPQYAEDVALAWAAMGRVAWPVLRGQYKHSVIHVRLAALKAGALLDDPYAATQLAKMTAHTDPEIRQSVAQLLGLAKNNIRAASSLHGLLDDDQRHVRLAAYESLVAIGDQLIQRTAFRHSGEFKFILDLVPSHRPLIYITHSPVPRVVIFDPMLGFVSNEVIALWDNQLMLRRDKANALTVYYQQPGQIKGIQAEIAPTAANLIYLMAHRPSLEHPMKGLDLQFSQVANALYTLSSRGDIQAPIEIQRNSWARKFDRVRQQQRPGQARPEISNEPLSGPSASGAPDEPGSPMGDLIGSDGRGVLTGDIQTRPDRD